MNGPADRPGRDDSTEVEAGLRSILDDLAHLVETARTMPMSSAVLINRAEVLGLIDELRDAMPEQLAHADEVLAEADRVLADAQRQAEDVLATARARAIELVRKEQVVARAEAEARDIVAAAEKRSTALQVDADDYCDRRLADFEVDLSRVLTQVQAGRAKLADRRGEGLVPKWSSIQDG